MTDHGVMGKFKAGDKVIIDESAHPISLPPQGVGAGQVIRVYHDKASVYGKPWIEVEWPNGKRNTYNHYELKIHLEPNEILKELV